MAVGHVVDVSPHGFEGDVGLAIIGNYLSHFEPVAISPATLMELS